VCRDLKEAATYAGEKTVDLERYVETEEVVVLL